ncbi:MAG TPA: PilT/PilU family type 4a pilus ATPase [Candidatus Angelobacter sp.]|jgi:twitching motility protein PilT|nr:PilT/PilU family type 4a pilus ATPase [Candidatus Angelobacter sp.]
MQQKDKGLPIDDTPKIELVRESDEPEIKVAGPSARARIDHWLSTLVERKGSDLLLVPGVPACIRLEGEVLNIEARPLSGPEIESAVSAALSPHALRVFKEAGIADSSYRIAGVGRFRINLHHERGRTAAAIRALPTRIPSIQELHLPPSVESLARLPRGLVLIGGPAGSGKSTTMAALIHEINRREARHILTIEDPIEYEHTHLRSVVEQVEIGIDAPDFPTALRAALRQAPDVLVVGEMRDPETMRIAVSAAETGHLVLSTLHTTDVGSTISRISDSFPTERQNTIRQELALALAAVHTQILLPSKLGGRVPAAELLVVGYGARQHIRRNALQHLHQEITMTKKSGSFSLEESLADLLAQGHIGREEAQLYAVHPDDLDTLIKARGRR